MALTATAKLNNKQQVFVTEYLLDFNATQAAIRAGYSAKTAGSIGQQLLNKLEVKAAIRAHLSDKVMSADEVMVRLSEQAHANLSVFFKVVEEWTYFPLPTYDIIDAKEVVDDTDPDNPVKRASYWVRHITIDLEKIMDPAYSHLLHKFSDSPKNGLGVEIYNKQTALQTLAKIHGLMGDGQSDDDAVPTEVIKLSSLPADVLAPAFLSVYRDSRDRKHMEYLLKGGRGSTKSSFASLDIIYLLVNNPGVHALAMRQVANTLRDSVYSQIVWAIGILGLEDSFKCITSPLEIEYKPTGQKIFFRGADKPEMVKSIKPTFGHIGILWFEELDQFHGEEAIRKIEQSTLRGGEEAWEFKTYNPPRTASNWVNKYVQIPKANQYQHHSTYLDVPDDWLGKTFVDEAEHLKNVNPSAYQHEYMGEVTGSGGMVFENVQVRKIADEEIAQFDRILMGVDWGFYPDPFAWGKSYYSASQHTLYIFDELKMQKAGNKETYEALVRTKSVTADDLLIADSAEPKSVADYRQFSSDGVQALDENGAPKLDSKGKPILLYGPSCRGAEKGPESVKYSMKWLQSLTAIVIDPERAPYHLEEFLNYELEQDKDGNFISEYPDRDNHFIDEIRYATNLIWKRRGQ